MEESTTINAPEEQEPVAAVSTELDAAEAASPETEVETEHVTEEEKTDYEKMAAEDLDLLKREFPELCELEHIGEIDNPLRYATLRDLGLTPQEAYLATRKRKESDTRAHLFDTVGRSASAPVGAMSQRELAAARELFGNMSDADIQRLYRKVSI